MAFVYSARTAVRAQDVAQPARAVIVPDAQVMALDDLGLYQLSYVLRGKDERFFPTGWVGPFEEVTGVACEPSSLQDGKRAWLLHPPWKNGTGLTRQSYTLALPKAKTIKLSGAFAMRASNTENSDGVTFRIFVDGDKLLDEHRKATQWKEFVFDLSRYAGRTVTVAFESDSGPQDNSSFDFALWGQRQIRFEGVSFPAPKYPSPIVLPLKQLASVSNGKTTYGIAPIGAYQGKKSAALSGGKAAFRYEGADGVFLYGWQAPRTASDAPLGSLALAARMKTAQGQLAPLVRVPLALDSRLDWMNGLQPKWRDSHLEKNATGVTLISHYENAGKVATLRLAARLVGKSLVFDATCDQPWIHTFFPGNWGPTLRRRAISVPYYTQGHVYFLEKENLFVNAFNDWTTSAASGFDNNKANYNALTDGTYNLLRDRAIFAPAWNLSEVLPEIPNPASPYLREVGGKIVLDVWGGQYLDIATHLQELHDYGVRGAIVIIHDWQYHGYDNGLPTHYPAQERLGGDAAMKQLVATATKLGYRISLHENYVDYYPNYEHFDVNDISLNSDGSQGKAWYNEGTKIQSFAEKPTAILRYAKEQSPEIHRRYGTNANYLDVHSAVPPWFHVDFRAGEEGAGKFSEVFNVHRDLWQFERDTHKGPVLGEGNEHWRWSGLLDGVEAQVDGGWNTSVLADFDLLKMHPLQSNHGMGYYERWWNTTGWGQLPPMQVLDRYRVQTLAFGHAGFLGSPTWNDVRLAWQEHNLVTPVTARYATARPVSIDYFIEGKWHDVSAAQRLILTKVGAGSGLYNRLRVRYDNGLALWANNTASAWKVGEVVLPAYGWKAEGAGVSAATSLHNGVVADFAQTATSTYANARNVATWNLNGEPRSRLQVSGFAQTASRTFRLNYQWTVKHKYASDYRVFVHFTPANATKGGDIAFQGDFVPSVPTSSWEIGKTIEDRGHEVHVPETAADGDYTLAAGLFDDKGRVPVEGDTDMDGRTILGVIQLRYNGQNIRFVPHVSLGSTVQQLYLQNLNATGKAVDFGSVRTDGSVMIRREGADWVLQTLPRDQKMTVELSAARFGSSATIRAVGNTNTVLPTRRVNLSEKVAGWSFVPNGAREYRWKASAIAR